MGWKDNAIMEWAGTKVTDHGRDILSENTEWLGTDQRMHDGTLRRQHIGLKRTWSTSWADIPSTNTVSGGMSTVDAGMSGEEIEDFVKANVGKFRLVLRRGSALDVATPNPTESQLPYEDDDFYIANVMITDFSKDTVARGIVDRWNISITLEEV